MPKKAVTRLDYLLLQSGKLYAQIRHGAPFDLLFSADQNIPIQLIQDGLADKNSRFTYASGSLVLVSSVNQGLDASEALQKSRFNKLAIANPRLAPYGKAAREVLRNLGLEDKLDKKIVLGENISQAYQFVISGNAELGIIARSQIAMSENLPKQAVWNIPPQLYSPIAQDAVLLKKAKSKAGALAFLNFIKSNAALEIIRQYGYDRETSQLNGGI